MKFQAKKPRKETHAKADEGGLNMSEKVTIIAEIGQAHDGSLGILHSYIDALASTGVDAVKFQMHIADAESSADEPFRVPFSYVDRTRYDYWKRMEFTFEQWSGIRDHCVERGVEFLVSPFSVTAVELLERLCVKRYKIASGEVSNYLMLGCIANTAKPLLISTGMSDFAEISSTLSFLDKCGASSERVLFQCTTAYPTQPEQWGLNVLAELRQRFGLLVGWSDHSGTLMAPLAAATLGAKFIECHAVFDRRMFGPDAKASLTIAELTQLVDAVRSLERAMLSPVDKDRNEQYAELKVMFGKSLAIRRDMKAGDEIAFEDLETKKPAGKGADVKNFQQFLGRKLLQPLSAGSYLNLQDID